MMEIVVPEAAKELVRKVFRHVEQLADHPQERLEAGWRYRQIVEPPCRIFYREEGSRVFILYVMRAERLLRPEVLRARGKQLPR